MSWHKAGDYYSDLSTSHMMCSWRTAHQSLPNKLRTYNTISELSGMVSLKITSATDWWTADIWGASREGNLAFALLRGSTPQAVLQAKIFPIHFKDDELTFYTEATLDNRELQSDKGKLTDILVRKPAWQWEEQEKKILLIATPVPFYLNFLTFVLFLNFCTLLNWIAVSHNLSYMLLERKATSLTLASSLPCKLMRIQDHQNIRFISCLGLSKCLFFLIRNSTAKELFEENLLSSHFLNFLFFFSLSLV